MPVDLPFLVLVTEPGDVPVREGATDDGRLLEEVVAPPELSLKISPVEGGIEAEEPGGVVGKPVMCFAMYAPSSSMVNAASLRGRRNIAASNRARSLGSSIPVMNF